METRRDTLLAVIIMTGASIALAFVTIGLFVRMAPAVTDASIQHLASAGAWAAAIGGVGVTVLGFLVYLRLERRIVRPARELARVLGAARRGDLYQRCRTFDGTTELEQTLAAANHLIDKLPGNTPVAASDDDPKTRQNVAILQRAMAKLLEREPGAVVLYAIPDGVLAASSSALDRLARDRALKDRIARAVTDGGGPGLQVEPLEPGHLLLCYIE